MSGAIQKNLILIRTIQTSENEFGGVSMFTPTYQHMNCSVVFNKTKDAVLFCKRMNDPYEGCLNFVGGKVEQGESSIDAAYRELQEETGITPKQIQLYHFMDITYYHQEFVLEMYTGILEEEVKLHEEKNPLLWLPLTEDFTDRDRFAGEQNIAHIINVALKYPIPSRDMMSEGKYIGIDGCSNGWIAVTLDYGQLRIKRYNTLSEIIDANPLPATFLIDMPIGLPEKLEDDRPDTAARKELGERGCTVFSVPCRQVLQVKGQNREAIGEMQKEINKRVLEKSLSNQSIAIIPKIKEVDDFLQAHREYKEILCESHPELCFARLKGSVLQTKKSSIVGATERAGLLSKYIIDERLEFISDLARELGCKPDDILDAACLAVTAAFKAHSMTETILGKTEKDAKELPMQMIVPKNCI